MPIVNKIRKTITTSVCIGQCVNDHGEFEDFVDVITRDVTPSKASVILRKKYHNQSIVINCVEKESHVYELSIEDFLAVAKEVKVAK